MFFGAGQLQISPYNAFTKILTWFLHFYLSFHSLVFVSYCASICVPPISATNDSIKSKQLSAQRKHDIEMGDDSNA